MALAGLGRRANRTLGEVIALLRSGYADGAFARSRTLHEIAVVSTALLQNDDELAQRYVDHSDVDSCDAAEDLYLYREFLGDEDAVTLEELEDLRKRKADLQEKWDRNFVKPYGWAIPLLKPRTRPSFRALEEAVEMDSERPYYKLACLNVHADPRSLFSSIGLPREERGALPGASDAGLLLPAVQSTGSAAIAIESLLLLVPGPETYLRCMVMWLLADAVRSAFEEGERVFQEGRLARLQEEMEERLGDAQQESGATSSPSAGEEAG